MVNNSPNPLNFYAGPGKLPKKVLERIQNELLDYQGTGMSVMEISHRAPQIIELIERTQFKLRKLMGLDPEDDILFLQGGGSLQFLMVPMNLSHLGDPVDYVDTGYWTSKAIDAARSLGRDVHICAQDYEQIPELLDIRDHARYLHICTNNTVMGTQWQQIPDSPIPLVADMSSDILSRKMGIDQFDLIYAHAQKTIGSAGVTIVIIPRKTQNLMLEGLTPFFDYRAHIAAKSNYHTPPVFAIYIVECMLDWLKDEIGGLENMEIINHRKARLLYETLDKSQIFRCAIPAKSRSMMNVVFSALDKNIENAFSQACHEQRILGIDGHRSKGGFRASLYNAVTLEEVTTLSNFMIDFERQYG